MTATRRRLVALAILLPALVLGAPGSALGAPAAPATTSASTAAAATTSAAIPAAASTTGAAPSSAAGSLPHAPGPRCTTNPDAQYPVICRPRGFDEDEQAILQPGDESLFIAQLVDNGPTVADATFTVVLQRPLLGHPDVQRIDDFSDEDGGRFPHPVDDDPDCTAAADKLTITCQTGPIVTGTNALLVVDFDVAKSAPVDSVATITETLRPVAPTSFLATSVRGTVRVLAPAVLRVSLSRKKLSVVVGSSAKLIASIHNVGRGPAPETVVFAVSTRKHPSKPSHFVITSGTRLRVAGGDSGGGQDGGGDNASGGDTGSASPAQPVTLGALTPLSRGTLIMDNGSYTRQRRMLTQRRASRRGPSVSIWPVHTIAPGQTKTLTVRVKAQTVGVDRLYVAAISANVSGFDGHNDDGDGLAHAKLIATTAPSTHTEAGSGAGSRLANSGPLWLGQLIAGGLLALLVGTALLLGARRPPPARVARHRH